ncbi:glucosamine--fructose-6-phosphate aminotransferase (plasmid) [Mycobacterium sp. THAF192]|nr:glucosamine--fructose-6-phosphate aminotransferase [Mycobacterium sp. THAF192]
MCILSFLPAGVPADVDGLFNGGINNPHGHGWAIVDGERIVAGKSLDLADALDDFIRAREKRLDGPALFHSRWATHGSIRIDNVHPFAVGGRVTTVVAHNGILPAAAHPDDGDDRSDTRKFADEILPGRFRRLDRRTVQSALAQWCGAANKLVILTVEPRYRRNAYLVNEPGGTWDESTGIWHSNRDYQDYSQWRHCEADGIGSGPGDAATEPYVSWCGICGYGVVDSYGYCTECRSCADCYEHVRYCMCWCGRGYRDALGDPGSGVVVG